MATTIQEDIEIDLDVDYIQCYETPSANTNEFYFTNEKTKNGCFMRLKAFVECKIINPMQAWLAFHWAGRLFASILQLTIIGNMLMDTAILLCVMKYGEWWWFYISSFIIYLSLRLIVVFTIIFYEGFFDCGKFERDNGQVFFHVWNVFRKAGFRLEHGLSPPTPYLFLLLYLPGAWVFMSTVQAQKNKKLPANLKDNFILLSYGILVGLVTEIMLAPIYIVLFSPIIFIQYVMKGIKNIWNTKALSFYDSSLEMQTAFFYSAISLLFFVATETVPQFILQTRIYWFEEDVIPATTYFTAYSFSMANILKAVITLTFMRKELEHILFRLVNRFSVYEDDLGILQECNYYNVDLDVKRLDEASIVQVLRDCHNIRDLDMAESGITNVGVKKVVKHMTQLHRLVLSQTGITDDGLIAIAQNCDQLISLDLMGTKITDDGITVLAEKCHQLSYLDLEGTQISDHGLKAIAEGCKQMSAIDLMRTKITDDGLMAIAASCSQLVGLRLVDTKISDEGLKGISANCHDLNILNLWNTKITDEGLKSVAANCYNLKSLNLWNTVATDEGLEAIAATCHQLNSLDAGGTLITDSCLKSIVINCKQLNSLTLCWTNITDEGLALIAANCPQLLSLNLRSTCITDKGLIAIAENCLHLHSLHLRRTNISDASLTALATSCHSLKSLNLSKTNVTEFGISELLSSCKQIIELDLSEECFPEDIRRKYHSQYPDIDLRFE